MNRRRGREAVATKLRSSGTSESVDAESGPPAAESRVGGGGRGRAVAADWHDAPLGADEGVLGCVEVMEAQVPEYV